MPVTPPQEWVRAEVVGWVTAALPEAQQRLKAPQQQLPATAWLLVCLGLLARVLVTLAGCHTQALVPTGWRVMAWGVAGGCLAALAAAVFLAHVAGMVRVAQRHTSSCRQTRSHLFCSARRSKTRALCQPAGEPCLGHRRCCCCCCWLHGHPLARMLTSLPPALGQAAGLLGCPCPGCCCCRCQRAKAGRLLLC